MPISAFVWAIGSLIASFAIQVILRPTPQKQKAAALEDFDFPQVDEGTPQAVIFGDVWIEDWHVLWYGNLRTSKIRSKGGKK